VAERLRWHLLLQQCCTFILAALLANKKLALKTRNIKAALLANQTHANMKRMAES